jgi:hypothetical protein
MGMINLSYPFWDLLLRNNLAVLGLGIAYSMP